VNFSTVILAAGQGQRMRSSLPKVLHLLAGVPLLERIINTVKKLESEKIVVIYGHRGEQLKKALAHIQDIIWVDGRSREGRSMPYFEW